MTGTRAWVPAGRGGPQRIPRPPGARLGPPPDWADLAPTQRHLDAETACAGLSTAPRPKRSPVESLTDRASAVLVPLYPGDDGGLHLLLTRRAWHLRSHTGEVSFPGGRAEPADDSLWETALRETWEETAMDTGEIELVGELDHLSTVTSRSFIVPFVGLLPDRPDAEPNPDEVDEILHVPVAELLDPAIYRQERWGVPGVDRPIHFFELVGDTIWGATASMLVDLLTRITGPVRETSTAS